MTRYWRKTYRRRDGTVVQGHWVNGQNGTTSTPSPSPYSPPPSYPPPARIPNQAAPRPRNKKRRLAIAVTATVVITAGAVTFTVTRGGSAGASDSVSVQANIDFKKAVAGLEGLGFAGNVSHPGTSDSSQNCSQSSTGDVKQFLIENPCKEDAVALAKLHRQGIVTQAVISWVVMPTRVLNLQYKKLVDERYRGNPPGQSTDFNGLCYASGQDDDATWVAQVQPTGQITVDQQILQAIAPVKLSTNYLGIHCIKLAEVAEQPLEPPRRNQRLGRGQDTHDHSMSTCRAR